MMDASKLHLDSFHPIRLHTNKVSLDLHGNTIYERRSFRANYKIDSGCQIFIHQTRDRFARSLSSVEIEFPAEGHNQPRDPFATDIYYSENIVYGYLLSSQCFEGVPLAGSHHLRQETHGSQCLEPLNKMVAENPKDRPTIKEVVSEFRILRSFLSSWTLQLRLLPKKEATSIIRTPLR